MQKLFSILFILGSSNLTFGQTNWKLIYENDETGKPVVGKIESLLDAVRSGEEIRIYYNSQKGEDDLTYVEHAAVAKFLTVLNSPDGLYVTAQIDPIIGQTPDFKEGKISFKENMEWSLIASTSGVNSVMMRNVITGEVISHQTRNWGTRWFVRK